MTRSLNEKKKNNSIFLLKSMQIFSPPITNEFRFTNVLLLLLLFPECEETTKNKEKFKLINIKLGKKAILCIISNTRFKLK